MIAAFFAMALGTGSGELSDAASQPSTAGPSKEEKKLAEARRKLEERRAELVMMSAESGIELQMRELDTQIAELKIKTGQMKLKQNEVGRRLDTIETEASYNDAGVGIAVGFDTRKNALFAIEANWKYIYGYYYSKHGFGVGLTFTWSIWRLKIRYLSTGFHIYVGDPMSAPYLRRSWDLSLGTGFDLVIWKGLAFRFNLAWFLPNPVAAIDVAVRGIVAASRDSGYEGWEGVDPAINAGTIYLDAFKTPWFFFGTRWLF